MSQGSSKCSHTSGNGDLLIRSHTLNTTATPKVNLKKIFKHEITKSRLNMWFLADSRQRFLKKCISRLCERFNTCQKAMAWHAWFVIFFGTLLSYQDCCNYDVGLIWDRFLTRVGHTVWIVRANSSFTL